ncbi:Acetylesterase [Fusarium oxysporum f. sp. albedinis]|nr:Acetylesterase [Fusarium oxysporum f. sp. albedinis]
MTPKALLIELFGNGMMCSWIEAWLVIVHSELKPLTMLQVPNTCMTLFLCGDREEAPIASAFGLPAS